MKSDGLKSAPRNEPLHFPSIFKFRRRLRSDSTSSFIVSPSSSSSSSRSPSFNWLPASSSSLALPAGRSSLPQSTSPSTTIAGRGWSSSTSAIPSVSSFHLVFFSDLDVAGNLPIQFGDRVI